MNKTIDVKISKIKSSFNTYEASYYDTYTNSTFSAIFENNVLGVIAINHFIKMIKSRFHEGNIKIVPDEENSIGMGEVASFSDIYGYLE